MQAKAPPKTESKASGAPQSTAFTIGQSSVPPGTLGHVEIPVARLPTGTWLSIPVAVLHGARQGPAIWLSAAIHGDEVNGVAIIHRVVENIKPELLTGTIIAVPVVNVFGLVNESRYLPDRRDLNRSFPGSRRGSLAAQLARLFMVEVVERCELGIDLHTGSGGRTNLPQLRCDLDEPRTRRAAQWFLPPIVIHATFRDGSLREAAREKGIPVLLYEGGEASYFDEEAIRVGVEGVGRVVAGLGMYGKVFKQRSRPLTSRRTSWIRAKQSGFCEILARRGSRVRTGDPVAMIFDTLARDQVLVRSDREGIVVGHLRRALVNRGDAVIHIAEID